MMLRKTMTISSILTALLAARVAFSSPLPGSPSSRDANARKTNETNILKTSTVQGDVDHQDKQDEKSMVEDCTLKALGILLSNQEDELSEGCKDILSLLVQKASGKQRHSETPEEVNLRRELNDLAEKNENYDALSQQIQNAQNLLAEKRLSEVDDADLSEPDPSRQAKSTNDELVDFNSDNFRSVPLLRTDKNFQRPYDYKQRYFDNMREMPDRRRDDLWNRDFSDESNLAQLTMPNDRNDILDDDFLVIPLRFLRKNLMSERQPTGPEFFGNSKANFPPPMTNPRKWYGNKNEMVNSLLRSLMSSEGRKAALVGSPDTDITNMNEDSKSVDESANNGEMNAKRENVQNVQASNLETYDEDEKARRSGLTALDRNTLSQVENDIKTLRKDLLRLQVGHSL